MTIDWGCSWASPFDGALILSNELAQMKSNFSISINGHEEPDRVPVNDFFGGSFLKRDGAKNSGLCTGRKQHALLVVVSPLKLPSDPTNT